MNRTKNFLIWILSFHFCCSSLNGQVWQWARGINWLGDSKACTFDKDGNVVIAGTLGNGFVIKYSPNGAVLWNKGLFEKYPLGIATSDSAIVTVGNGYMASSSFIQQLDHMEILDG